VAGNPPVGLQNSCTAKAPGALRLPGLQRAQAKAAASSAAQLSKAQKGGDPAG